MPAERLTDRLRREHGVFRGMLVELESARGPAAEAEVLRRLLPLLAAHERLEREELYPSLLRGPRPLAPKVVAAFDEEHERVREKLSALRAALDDRDAELGRLVAVAEFIGFLRDHLEEEEATLFPMAEGRPARAGRPT